MSDEQPNRPSKGRLLVASPSLVDPNFDRTVILLLEHTEEGALGVVLNRPSDTAIGEGLEEWAPLAAEPATIFVGGPVDPTAIVAVARCVGDEATAGMVPVDGRLVVVDLHGSATDVAGHVAGVRVFAGYAGWAPGQLEDEIAEGAWYVLDALDADVTDADPTELWWRVVGRQPGRLRRLANFPPRLHWN